MEKAFWLIHSVKDGRPALEAWAASETEVQRLLHDFEERFKGDRTRRFWASRVPGDRFAALKRTGFIPKDAELA